MKTSKNLFRQFCNFRQLHKAFIGASRGKRHKTYIRRFECHLEERLIAIKDELEQGQYQWGGYHAFLITDPKPRMIHAAPFRDRVVHHALHNLLEPLFEPSLIFDTYACRKGKGTHAAVARYDAFAKRVGRSGYVLKCDIRQYFSSIDHDVLKGLVRRKIGDIKLLRLLDSLIDTHPQGIPIGNLTSQLFANLYLSPLDHYLKEKLRQKHYIRYMDDFVILAREKEELWLLLEEIRSFLDEQLHLKLNPARLAVMPLEKGVDFLGYIIWPGGFKRIRRRNVVNFRRRLKGLSAGVEERIIDYEHARASIASWTGLAIHANAFRLSQAIFMEGDVNNIGKRLLLLR